MSGTVNFCKEKEPLALLPAMSDFNIFWKTNYWRTLAYNVAFTSDLT